MNTLKGFALGGAVLVLATAGAIIGSAPADPVDPRSLAVSWVADGDFGVNAMQVVATSDADSDRRIVTTIVRTADSAVVHSNETKSQFDPQLGEPGPPSTYSETALTLERQPSGTALLITSQFYDEFNNLTATKVATWTKP